MLYDENIVTKEEIKEQNVKVTKPDELKEQKEKEVSNKDIESSDIFKDEELKENALLGLYALDKLEKEQGIKNDVINEKNTKGNKHKEGIKGYEDI